MIHPSTRLLSAAAVVTLAGCSMWPFSTWNSGAGPVAGATLAPTAAVSPNPSSGTVRFTPTSNGVLVSAEVRGLPPNTERGFHIHERGDCGNNGEAAGGHFNPGGNPHGRHNVGTPHGGDMPSLTSDGNGVARVNAELRGLSVGTGAANDIVGKAIIVHRDRDDYVTQPNGAAGPRITCGIIARS